LGGWLSGGGRSLARVADQPPVDYVAAEGEDGADKDPEGGLGGPALLGAEVEGGQDVGDEEEAVDWTEDRYAGLAVSWCLRKEATRRARKLVASARAM
jgi:hypothetical protein